MFCQLFGLNFKKIGEDFLHRGNFTLDNKYKITFRLNFFSDNMLKWSRFESEDIMSLIQESLQLNEMTTSRSNDLVMSTVRKEMTRNLELIWVIKWVKCTYS